tara:strand:- start:1404 stop:1706 length:303 start_codon:yes stop_codon:yes gene_type:complete
MGDVRPNSIKVLGQVIRVNYCQLPDCQGEYDPCEQLIKVDETLCPNLQRLVIWHELTHVIEDLFSIELSETDVCAISTGFVQIMLENKELVDWSFGSVVK